MRYCTVAGFLLSLLLLVEGLFSKEADMEKRDIGPQWNDLGWAWGKRSLPDNNNNQIPRRFLRALHPMKKTPDWGDLEMTERQGGELIDIEGNPQGQEDEDDELYSAESDQDGTAGNSKDQPGCSYARPGEDFSTSDSDDSDSSFDSSSDDFSQSNEEEDGAEKYRNEDDLDVYMSSEESNDEETPAGRSPHASEESQEGSEKSDKKMDEQSFSCEEDDDPEDDGLQYKYKAPEMPTREELAKLVLDYLICEGFREAAENLCEEMKLKVPEDLKVMDARVAIKDAIIEGNMEFAIDKTVELCPTLLDTNDDVRFEMRLQYLIEMIRANGLSDLDAPLKYARQYIVADEKISEEQMSKVEKAFALLVYENIYESPFAPMLDQSRRNMVANMVNCAILEALNRPPKPRMESLLKLIVWSRCQITGDPPQNSIRIAKELFENGTLDGYANGSFSTSADV
ncbi:hypothetical protein WR25_01909 [Diploscapter pachys]|uniref:CTLH domain-containing protein n=1 Tax=Diploscapter pachys TaxID=2018661 RepID=A0A2A2L426_9BILA|nr:hypothetical protein WR25_01909 [Diploscapter pachys]